MNKARSLTVKFPTCTKLGTAKLYPSDQVPI